MDGGWNERKFFEKETHLCQAILLDPLFWQSLGKAMGWGIEPSGSIWQGKQQCLIYWHDFIDALAEGQTAEQYFETIP
jgi:hypothetical protein